MRAWFARNAGLFCVAVGWAFAFLAFYLTPKGGIPEDANGVFVSMMFAVSHMGFGVGWIVREEKGKRDGR